MVISVRLTDRQTAVGDDGVSGLSDVGGVDQVVVRVAVLAVPLLHHRQEVFQTQRVDLRTHTQSHNGAITARGFTSHH